MSDTDKAVDSTTTSAEKEPKVEPATKKNPSAKPTAKKEAPAKVPASKPKPSAKPQEKEPEEPPELMENLKAQSIHSFHQLAITLRNWPSAKTTAGFEKTFEREPLSKMVEEELKLAAGQGIEAIEELEKAGFLSGGQLEAGLVGLKLN